VKVRFQFEGKEVTGYAQEIDGTVWIHFNGETKCIESASSSSSKSRSKTFHRKSDQILAPMPGKVTKIFKTATEAIKTGEAVIAIEAMKMEYILNAEIEAISSTILVKENEQVKSGQLLVQLNTSQGKKE
jgi:acetyl/propionyl-CoA carboxylase alpha subunit